LRRTPAAALAAILALGALATPAIADTIRVQSTTDTVDAGLVDGLLRDAYLRAQPGDTLNYTAVGTGKALDNARQGLADVVITHAPSLEEQFVKDGFSVEPYGRAIFYSDYVIVGPQNDPAGVLTSASTDAVTAFEKIAAAGQAGTATFVARGDNSGTNVQEQTMWGLTGDSVPKKPAGNAAGAAGRLEPSGGGPGGYPAWYRTTNKGQAASLQDTDVCQTSANNPNGGCYTIVDRGTFNRLVNAGTVTRLKIVAQKNAAAARGGEDLLVNPFSAYIVNPDKITTDPRPNVAAATRFVDFLTSQTFQDAVNGFPSASDPAFRADAFPQLTVVPPTTGLIGQPVRLELQLSNRLPGGGGGIAGLPVQLQASTDGTTFANVGAPVATDSQGSVTFAPVLGATTTYRVSLPRFRQFSPNVQTIGVVTGIAPPTPPGGRPAPLTPDTTAPTVRTASLSARRLTVRVSEAATIKATFRRRTTTRVKGRTRTSYRTVRTLTLKATKAGTVSRTFKALAAGTYRVTLVATDAVGNRKQRTVPLKVKTSAAKR
jgi:tungstate transport system substrate-binding protein